MRKKDARPALDLEALLECHYARIHRAALALTGSPWDADDLAQETFLEAAGALGRFAGQSTEYTWLYAVLLNRYRRWRRQRRWLHLARTVWQRLGGARSEPSADREPQLCEWRASLWRYVSLLPPRHSDVLVLRFAEGLSQEEIAAVLGCPVGTVKSRLHHALATLRSRLPGAAHDWLDSPSSTAVRDHEFSRLYSTELPE